MKNTPREIAGELDSLGYLDQSRVSQREPWKMLDEVAAIIIKHEPAQAYVKFLEDEIAKVKTGQCPNCSAALRSAHCCVCEGCDGCRNRQSES